MNEWRNFKEGTWCNEINVSDFIKNNYVAYTGNESFLAGPTEKTKRVKKYDAKYKKLFSEEE